VTLLYGVTAMLVFAAVLEAFWSSGGLAAAGREVRDGGCVLDGGARLPHDSGATCRLRHWRCGCGREPPWKRRPWYPPVSERGAVDLLSATRWSPSGVVLAIASIEIASWLPGL
jgi:hypothetical protein